MCVSHCLDRFAPAVAVEVGEGVFGTAHDGAAVGGDDDDRPTFGGLVAQGALYDDVKSGPQLRQTVLHFGCGHRWLLFANKSLGFLFPDFVIASP